MRGNQLGLREIRALLAIGLLGACSGGGGGDGTPGAGGGQEGGGDQVDRGQVVGKLQHIAPAQDEYILRATLPVPPGTVPVDGEVTPLAVVINPGITANTQVNVVTRYPNAEDGASVVEVMARVRRSPGVVAGDEQTYYVVRHPHEPVPMRITGTLRDMLGAKGALTLRSKDVFGNAYEADLFQQVVSKSTNARKSKSGPIAHEYALHEVMLPVSPKDGAKGTLPHLMGVHAYVTTFDREDWFLLDLHVHNGMDGLDKSASMDDALDELLFTDLRLRLPGGWKASVQLQHTSLGKGASAGDGWELPIVKPLSSGKLHSLPKQGRFVRRLAVYREGHEGMANAALRGDHIAFCQDGVAPDGDRLWSWWNGETARWFPQAHRLPDLSFMGEGNLAGSLEAQWDECRNVLASGSGGDYPLSSNALGWAQPWGVQYGGMTGGDEIHVVDGIRTLFAASSDGYRLAALTARCYMDRQPTALYAKDGRPTKYEDLLITEGMGAPYVDCTYSLKASPSSDPFGFNDAPQFQIDAAEAQGLNPPYGDNLAGWMPIDQQHYIRYTRALKILAWMANDTLAKDQLVAAAEVFRLGYHAYPNGKYGYVQGSGLKAKIDHVAAHPGQGVDFHRSDGWGIDAGVAAYLLGDDDVRERFYPWFEEIATVVQKGQSTCTGNIMATPVGKLFDGDYVVRMISHSSYADNALRGMQKSVFEGRDDGRAKVLGQMLAKNAKAQSSAPFWNEQAGQPYDHIGVGPVEYAAGEFCNTPPADAFSKYTKNSAYYATFAYAFQETGNELFLFRSAQMLGGGDLLTLLQQQNDSYLETTAPLIALMQEGPSQ